MNDPPEIQVFIYLAIRTYFHHLHLIPLQIKSFNSKCVIHLKVGFVLDIWKAKKGAEANAKNLRDILIDEMNTRVLVEALEHEFGKYNA